MTHALIVDDSRLACKVLADMLEPLQISSASVYSAEEALRHLQSHMPDIIFLDHTMKGMDGFETLKVIKSNPKTATIPVLMYTAKQGEVYVGQARALGAVDVLPKGLEKDYLHDALANLGLLPAQMKSRVATSASPAKPSNEYGKPTKEPGKPTIESSKKVPVNENKAAVSPAPPTPAKTSRSKSPDKKEAPAPVPANIGWREFWQQTIEPYLHRQRIAQTEEVIQFGKQQTRYINREMHKTMEHFEHALVLRLEAHDDFLESQRALVAERRRKWLAIGAVVVLAIQLLLVWQFFQLQQSNEHLLTEQQEWAAWRDQLDQQYAQLQVQAGTKQATPVKTTSSAPRRQLKTMALQNLQRELLAEVYPAPAGAAEYRGVTSNGYGFFINAKGEISAPPVEQYFLTDNCQGDVFIAAEPAQLFREKDGTLWYVDKASEEVPVNVSSQLNAKSECLPLADDLKLLRRLQRNISLETGIDEQDALQLVVN